MRLVLLLLISFTSSTSYASSTSSTTEIRLGGWSKHFNESKYFNEAHKGVFIEYKKLVVGHFENSYHSDTSVIGYTRHWRIHRYASIHASAGVSYGYRDCLDYKKLSQGEYNGKKFCPLVYAEIRFDAPLRPAVGLLGNAAVLTFGVKL